MTEPNTGLILNVMSHPSYRGCTTGPTATHDNLTLVGHIDRRRHQHRVTPGEGLGPFPVTEGRPAVALVVRDIRGEGTLSLEPVTWDGERWINEGWHSAGGSYATGDSRLSELARRLTGHSFYGAVSVHDRREW